MLTLTACGGDKKADAKEADNNPASATPSPAKPFEGLTPAQISEKSRLAMTKLKSFKVKGSMTSHGEEMTFDFTVVAKGDCRGNFTHAGASAELRMVGGHTYMKGDKKFWQQTGRKEGSSPEEINAITEMFKGRWFKVPAKAAKADDRFPFCDTAMMFKRDKKDGRLTRGAETEVNGSRAVTLMGKEGAQTQTLFVSAQGEPYVLRMTAVGGKEPGSLEFSAFNEPVTVTPPSASEVIDLDKLKR
ncbi:hypothetical protein [Streptomyces sp. NPDC058755]|uniref:hypothetical protein n=1 Tax=Streptomyces sp. NPDC058755 TaxID=3346624 RepID=UPI00367F056F